MLHDQVDGGAPLVGGEGLLSRQEPGRGEGGADIGPGGVLRDLLVLLPALELGGGELGRGQGGILMGIGKVQSGGVKVGLPGLRGL